MRVQPHLIVPLFLFLSDITVVMGQTCCSGGAPLTGALNIQALNMKGWALSLTYDNNVIQDLLQGSNIVNEDNIERRTETLMAQVDYGITENLTGTILVPYVWLGQTTRTLSTETNVKTSGIGDILLMSQFGNVLSNQATLIFGAGIKLPTGATQNADEESGIVLPATLQPGTGSVDFIISAQYQTSFKFRRSLHFTQTLNFRFNTPSSDFTFHDSYRFGHVFQSFSSLAEQLVIAKMLQTPSLTLRYRYSGDDILEGYPSDNTGGHWVYIGPGWAANLSSKLLVGLAWEIPVYRNLNGLQITTSHRWTLTVQYLFSNHNRLEL